MYRIRILQAASADLARLDQPIARRIVGRIRWLGENLENIRPQPLAGDLAGFYKLRVGDYRVVYEILHKERVILIHAIGHRREVYHDQ